MARKTIFPAVAVLAGLALAGCVEDEGPLDPPQMTDEQALFSHYVSLGNSITAGFQSGGINATTQQEAYPVLLAEAAGAPFGIPTLAAPGCPPPFIAPLGPRPEGTTDQTCGLRSPIGPRLVQNLAVPGARIMDLFTRESPRANPLTQLVLGGRTQIEAMQEANPTLVSAWIGNNDALEAAVSGIPARLTSMADFEADLDEMVSAIDGTDARAVVLLGVVDAVMAAPILQPGAYFWAIRDQLPKPVSDNCAPLTQDGTPNPLGANFVSYQAVGNPEIPAITCNPAELPEGSPFLLTPEERETIQGRVAAFNAAIAARAAAHHTAERPWIYVDPNAVLMPYLMAGPPFNDLRKCQMLPQAQTPEQFQAAVLQSCPVPPEMGGAPNFFGSLISFDGVHPSGAAHRLVAQAIAQELNQQAALGVNLSVP